MVNHHFRTFTLLARIAAITAFCVIVLGAFVRLSDAGLGCPDWPGCYGHLFGIPESQAEISVANQRYSDNLVHTDKAWKEVAHRYLAGFLGLIILVLAIISILNRRAPCQPTALPIFLLTLTAFQAILGMWTVTLLLQPVIVLLHLLGGMAILSLLWWLVLKTGMMKKPDRNLPNHKIKPAILITSLLVLQIALGGWTSANYAALACPDFPTCQQQWWPEAMNFKQAFTFWHETGINYALNPMDSPARTAIHVLHRIGAIIVLIATSLFLFALCGRSMPTPVRFTAISGLSLLIMQFALGVSNVLFHLPIAVATAHNGVGALLLLAMVTIVYMLKLPPIPKKF